jgi:hypothetical protein
MTFLSEGNFVTIVILQTLNTLWLKMSKYYSIIVFDVMWVIDGKIKNANSLIFPKDLVIVLLIYVKFH